MGFPGMFSNCSDMLCFFFGGGNAGRIQFVLEAWLNKIERSEPCKMQAIDLQWPEHQPAVGGHKEPDSQQSFDREGEEMRKSPNQKGRLG